MANLTAAFTALQNASLFEATTEAYTSAPYGAGDFFWPIILLFTLFLIHIKTESPAMVAIFAIIGNFTIAAFLFGSIAMPIFYGTLVFSFFIVLWGIFGSPKIES